MLLLLRWALKEMSTKFKVLQFLTSNEPAGTELMTLQLVKGLDQSRFEVQVTILGGDGPLSVAFQELGVPVYSLDFNWGPVRAIRHLARLLREQRYDLVHLYGFRTSLIGRLATRVLSPGSVIIHGIRGLHVIEGGERDIRTQAALFLERVLSPLVDVYLTNSIGAATFLVNHRISRQKIVAIPSGISIEEWPPGEGLRAEPPLIVCVGRFIPSKRHEDLVEALCLLRDRGLPFRSALIGYGPTLAFIRARLTALGLDSLTEFVGPALPADVRRWLFRAAVFALPSLREGMPGSVMEAMAAGLPVVATDVPGTNEVVIDGITGLLVRARSPGALADALGRLLSDPELRAQMGQAGRKRIEQEFSHRATVQGTEEQYFRAIARRHGLNDGREQMVSRNGPS